jgi:UDP-N-acetyl-D-galactosamine dehydrogenase
LNRITGFGFRPVAAVETEDCITHRACLRIYESTVYPGATEEVCVPVLESSPA